MHIWRTIIRGQGHSLVVLFGDEQLVIRIWHLLVANWGMYGDIVPFPGDLHMRMHLCHGILRIGGAEYILPIAEQIGHKYIEVEFQLKNWSKQDDFLFLFADAGMTWLMKTLPKHLQDISLTDLLARIQNNPSVSFF